MIQSEIDDASELRDRRELLLRRSAAHIVLVCVATVIAAIDIVFGPETNWFFVTFFLVSAVSAFLARRRAQREIAELSAVIEERADALGLNQGA